MRILALADDATGALEVGAQFAAAGVPAQIAFSAEAAARVSRTLIFDTETRHQTAQEAYNCVLQGVFWRPAHVFKKTDSTLRGHVAAEFRALLEAFPGRPLVYAPAYPALGRTVRAGELFVDGRRLAETAFAHDPLNPSANGFIPDLLKDCGAPVEVVEDLSALSRFLDRRAHPRVYVCDGESDDDLAVVARALHSSKTRCLAAGPAAFAGHWIRQLSQGAPPPLPAVRRCLVVNGSLHPVSRLQIDAAAAQSAWPVLTTPSERLADPRGVKQRLAASAIESLEGGGFDGLIVFGGDTLYTLLRALGIDIVEAAGEVLPGIPLSRARWRGAELILITKAGGFGPVDVIDSIRGRLERRA